MCDACDALVSNRAGVPAHAAMRPVGMPVREVDAGRGAWVIAYRCRVCDAEWHYHLDPGNPASGFQRVTTTPARAEARAEAETII